MASQLILHRNQKTSSTSSPLFLLLLLWLTKISAALSYAKAGCQEECGNVTIKYPFGIGAGCYFDERYSVECRNSNNTPYIKSINLEVLFISVYNNFVRVNNPVIISPNCPVINNNNNNNNGSNSSTSLVSGVNLTSSPFLISTRYIFVTVGAVGNSFVAGMGCNNHAVMTDVYNNKIVECSTPSCNSNSTENISRCMVKISKYSQYLQGFKVNFANISNTSGSGEQSPCAYAFLAQNDSRLTEYSIAVQNGTVTQVPLVLNWTFKGSVPKEDTYNSSYCFDSSYAISSSDGRCSFVASTTCRCMFFRGNPYILNGCLEECSQAPYQPWCKKSVECSQDPYQPWCNKSKSKSKMVIIGVCAGSTGLLFLLIVAWWLYKVIKKRNDRKCKEKFFKRNGGFLLQQQLSSSDGSVEKTKLFNSNELEKATDHYNENRILGQGGQGTVYKGMLSDGRIVAVKKSKVVDEGKVDQFINEVVILSQINHRNVLNLLGCCLETDVPLLVYEFIPNGTLFQHIHDPNEEFPLSWEMRFRIATEVAGALSYLHYAASVPIYHRDIKSSNILLDDKYKAKVSDFGTSRSIAIDQTHLTTLVQGTFGYLDPEYFQSSQFTEKSDVYSFGVVIVELLTGQKPISSTRSQESKSLVTHFMQSIEENHILEILDPRILKEGCREEIIAVAHLARRCLHLNGKKRPTMKDVAVELEGIRMLQGGSSVHQHYEEVEYNKTDLTEVWDVASTSTGTFVDGGTGTTSSFDVQPLLHSK